MTPRINLVQPIFYDSHLPYPPYNTPKEENTDGSTNHRSISRGLRDPSGSRVRLVQVGKSLKRGAFICVTASVLSWFAPSWYPAIVQSDLVEAHGRGPQEGPKTPEKENPGADRDPQSPPEPTPTPTVTPR